MDNEPKFSIAAEVLTRTGQTLDASLPQDEVIRLLGEAHAYHAARTGWTTYRVTHERIANLLGEALDRALAYAASTTPVETYATTA